MAYVSVVIPTFNKSEYLELTLASLAHQSFGDFEIVVINDGSTDDTDSVIRRQRDSRIVYRSQSNQGRSAARNAGVNAARGEIVIFCDDDRIVSPRFVEAHVRELQAAPSGIVLGYKRRALTIWRRAQLPMDPHEWLTVASRTPGLTSRMERCDHLRLVDPVSLMDDFEATIQRFALGDEPDNHMSVLKAQQFDLQHFRFAWVLGTTSNMSVLRKHLAGGLAFDEAYQGWGLEDTDLCYRLHLKGLRVRFSMDAVSYHQVHPLGGNTLREGAEQRVRDCDSNFQYFCRKFGTLESYLFWRCQGNLNLLMADELLTRVDGDTPVRDELMWVYKELLRLYTATKQPSLTAGVVSGQHLALAAG